MTQKIERESLETEDRFWDRRVRTVTVEVYSVKGGGREAGWEIGRFYHGGLSHRENRGESGEGGLLRRSFLSVSC